MTELKLKETFLPIVLINNELYGKKKWDGKSKKKVGWAKRGQVTDGEKNRRKSTRKYLQQTQTSHKLLLLEVGR